MNKRKKIVIIIDAIIMLFLMYFIVLMGRGLKITFYGYIGVVVMMVIALLFLMAIAEMNEWAFEEKEDL